MAMPVEKIIPIMTNLNQETMSLEELEGLRAYILGNPRMRRLLTQREIKKFEEACGKKQLSYNLIPYWGKQLAKTPEAIALGQAVLKKLRSTNPGAVIWGYFQVLGVLERKEARASAISA